MSPEAAIRTIGSFDQWVRGCTIRSQSRYVKFQLFEWQKQLSELMNQHRKICIFKVRQIGCTEFLAARMNYAALTTPGYSGIVFSIGAREATKVQERVKRLDQSVTWVTDNKSELELPNGSRLMFLPSTDKGARSLESVTDILIDEAGFNPKIELLYSSSTASQAMAGENARLMIASTMPPAGQLSWFWQTFTSDCPEDVNIVERIRSLQTGEKPGGFDYWIDNAGWCKILLHWRAHPIFRQDPNYLENTRIANKLTEEQLGREYDLRIPESGASLFSATAVKDAARGAWSAPASGRRYVVGVDPNFAGTDYFVAIVLDITEEIHSIVHEYAENRRTVEYSITQVCGILDRYRPELLAVETNSGGAIVRENLCKIRPNFRIEGFTTTRASKMVGTDRVAIRLEHRKLIYPPDWKGIEELTNFSAASREAVYGHDDRVMALTIAEAWAGQVIVGNVGRSIVWF